MRETFVRTLCELAERDERILLLTGDLGFTVVEPFAERFPDRFFNLGVAEQNMVGVATGLAEAGFIPYVYSIVTFATLRPYEFIRNGPVLHQLPVRIVGIGGGYGYGPAGPTHHGLEDVGVMRLQPGLAVIAPADNAQAATAVRATYDLPGPVYYRLDKSHVPALPGLDGRFELGRAHQTRGGRDLLLVALGSIAAEAEAAAAALEARGIGCGVLAVSSVSPPPLDDLADALGQYRLALTVEAHYVDGGLGSLVSEVIAERGIGCRVLRHGARSLPAGRSGSERYFHREQGIGADDLVATALAALAPAAR
jgi:transketolase